MNNLNHDMTRTYTKSEIDDAARRLRATDHRPTASYALICEARLQFRNAPNSSRATVYLHETMQRIYSIIQTAGQA